MSAVILLQEMMLRKKLDPTAAQDEDLEDSFPPAQVSGGAPVKDHNKDKVAVLAIAYHNMGVEQEFLRSYPAAILSYKKAVNFAEKHLGPEDGITQNLRSVYENAKNELDMALFKKGKKGGKGVAKKGKKMQYEQVDMGDPRQEYVEMMQPRENMERVEED